MPFTEYTLMYKTDLQTLRSETYQDIFLFRKDKFMIHTEAWLGEFWILLD